MAISPMMQKYLETKQKHPDCIVFYRLGDFYEMFFDDAELVSREIGLTLTGRDCGLEKRAPMCGIPHHSYQGYVKKLVDKGYRVAICEQLTAPQKGKTLVERDVVKIITAGTINDENFLDGAQNNFIASVFCGADTSDKNSGGSSSRNTGKGAVSWCDITTGQFYAIELDGAPFEKYSDILGMISPSEIICNVEFAQLFKQSEREYGTENSSSIRPNAHYDYAFGQNGALEAILNYFGIMDVGVFDFKKQSSITKSSGALIEYLMMTQKQRLANITKIQVVKNGEYMILDKAARENLELTHQYREPANKRGSLLWVLDDTKTAMGARLLTNMINQPLQDIKKINARLDAVGELIENRNMNANIMHNLSKIFDIYRLGGKIASGDVFPRDMLALAKSLAQIKDLKKVCADAKSGLLKSIRDNLKELTEIEKLVAAAINENPPAMLGDGGYIKVGYNEKLDEYRAASTMGREWIAKLEAKERIECQIKQLKIGYNRVSGYYFEVPLSLSNQVPYRFTRRATTTNTERYITQELKEIEDKITGAEEKAIELENKLYGQIKTSLKMHLEAILTNAEAVAQIDVLRSFAAVAAANRWVRPKLNEEGVISLAEARHPVIEKIIGASRFIANDCVFDAKNTTMIITGPNMAGKSTYMRTVALTVLLSHIGCFVPCKEAVVALTDRIFTRIGASDSMLTGQSTFMVEMSECSNIIHNATKNSLILLDEVGRGTGTNDGLALASSIITYITDKIEANTMFATHFHQLTELGNANSKIKNYKALTAQIEGQIVFLHKIEPGIEENSFGIDVARMAGLPSEVLDNARKLYNIDRTNQTPATKGDGKNKVTPDKDSQMKELPATNPLVSKLQEIDINRLSPMEALIVLGDLTKEAKKKTGNI